MNTLFRSIIVCGLAFSMLAALSGCGDSDAKRMAEFRKLARNSTTGNDEEDEAAAPPIAMPQAKVNIQRNPSLTPKSAATQQPDDEKQESDQTTTARKLVGGTDTMSAPDTPYPVEERRQRTIDNMAAIGQAFELYLKQNRKYPASFIANAAQRPILSWRVAILPYLGYDELFAQFRTDEAWDSTHNAKLIEKIPAVFQSPDRFDQLTNYLVPYATTTAFFGPKGKMTRRWEDGAKNTILLVEVDDTHAVPWTQPEDLHFDARKPDVGLGNLRSDGFFSVWGGGEVALVPKAIRGLQLKAAFTVDGGESLLVSEVKRPALATVGGLAARFRPNAGATATSLPATARADSGLSAPSTGAGTVSAAPAATGRALPDAQAAFTAGREADAVRLYYRDIISGQSPETWLYQFRWMKGLSRPAPILRYGIGIDWVGAKTGKAKELANNAVLRNKASALDAYRKLTKTFGVKVLETLKSRPLHSPFYVETAEPTVRRRRSRNDDDDDVLRRGHLDRGPRLAPCIQLLGVDSERVLLKAARKHEVDVLVLFELKEKRSGGSADYRVRLFDVVRQKEIYETQRLNSRKVEEAKNRDLLEDDPTIALLGGLVDFIEDHLTPEELPDQLKARHAQKRVAQLSQASHDEKLDTPLRAMSEIQFYYRRKLVDAPQMVNAYKALLNEADAYTLVSGDLDDQIDVLSPYLPREDVVANASQQR